VAEAPGVLALARAAAPGAVLRLPRGRHKLDPAQVAASQRARLYSAMASVTAAKGYAATTVADLLAAAGVSRETFYELFRSKGDCFEHAFDEASELLFALVARAAGGPSPAAGPEQSPAGDAVLGRDRHSGRLGPVERFGRFLGAYLDALASYPDLARLCLVEVYAAGPSMARRRAETQERFATALEALFDVRDDEERFACRALVAAIGGMVTARLAAGDTDGLRALREPLTAFAGRTMTGARRLPRQVRGALS
jgi:AcrR family transcriptional regulator